MKIFVDKLRRYSARNMSDAWAILAKDTYKGVISGLVYGPHTVLIVCVPHCIAAIDQSFVGYSLGRFRRFNACPLRNQDLS
jgi:hypothetical protein